ncbi:hypothetical protein MAPG_05208 [Magnaporthiopsis poae ATCC 64411]|uniref:Uncharacterized protein n=1 Tax=Magnaporthiopsis poae (strain ATCC 64411 / 73-15) TaxID=644358 RepID=A0A0C4DYS9_MAGP6|nr:hypothetical protein MAPG_05208 [Magnaporthiopsis poae ATCC 64411]
MMRRLSFEEALDPVRPISPKQAIPRIPIDDATGPFVSKEVHRPVTRASPRSARPVRWELLSKVGNPRMRHDDCKQDILNRFLTPPARADTHAAGALTGLAWGQVTRLRVAGLCACSSHRCDMDALQLGRNFARRPNTFPNGDFPIC